jgi:hypothetical protein
MYKNKFLAIIKKDGLPIRELAGAYIGLPFNTEYTIELRNDNYQRAVARIYIDGMEAVLGGIVINKKSSVTLERFVLDGNMNEGKRFKFVELTDATGIDPQDMKNGIVEIVFTLEKAVARPRPPIITYDSTIYPNSSSTPYIDQGTYKYDVTDVSDYNRSTYEPTVTYTSNTLGVTTSKTLLFDSVVNYPTRSVQKQGVTAEGSVSHQQFDTVTMGELEKDSTTITFFLNGVETIIDSKIYCTKCGKKTKSEHTFCPHCGARIELE